MKDLPKHERVAYKLMGIIPDCFNCEHMRVESVGVDPKDGAGLIEYQCDPQGVIDSPYMVCSDFEIKKAWLRSRYKR